MKTIHLIIAAIFTVSIVFVGCTKDKDPIDQGDIMPEKFKVDIPSSISNSTVKSDKDFALSGDDIYSHLTTFIAVGEGAADIVQDIIWAIRIYDLDQAMSFSYESDDDGRTKHVEIIENSEFEGTVWEYQLTTTDEDGGKALQVFWNNNPIKGIALLNPYNIDRTSVNEWSQEEQWTDENTMYRVDYSEDEVDYEARMIVYITDLKLPEDTAGDNRFAMETLKMFVGKNGDIVDVYGNSNHPLASFFDDDAVGFNWAFSASADESTDKAVAEVGLPPSNLDATERATLLETYSIYNVFYTELTELGIPEDLIVDYLVNTEAPGYFNSFGFVTAGDAPSGEYSAAESSMNNLTPYNPLLISNLSIQFKDDDAS